MTDRPGLSADARAMMIYDARKKNALVAFLLWFFLGIASAHRFYMGRKGGVWQMLFGFVGVLLFGAIPFILAVWALWWIFDAFAIPRWVREHNTALVESISSEAPATV